jgi:hypothetical protein
MTGNRGVSARAARGLGRYGVWALGGLRVSGKIFAMLVNGELVEKLPKDRVDSLAASGVGHNFDPGHGRFMKEWIAVSPKEARRWPGLVEEARDFVARAGRRSQ